MAEVLIELNQLSQLTRSELIGHWVKTFDKPVPKHLSLPMMRRIIAFKLQSETHGGLTATTRRRLENLSKPGSKAILKTQALGTRLIREWNGVTHTVEVHDNDFQWQGRHYRSLSAIAKEITGAHWSGPRFFQTNKVKSNAK